MTMTPWCYDNNDGDEQPAEGRPGPSDDDDGDDGDDHDDSSNL